MKRATIVAPVVTSITSAAMACMVILLAGCMTVGTGFKPVSPSEVPSDKALVYIYRPSRFYATAVTYDVKANGQSIVRLSSGSYFPYIATPGKVQFTARLDETGIVIANVKAGGTYYVRGTLSAQGIFLRPELELVSEDRASGEIRACSLITQVMQ